MLYSLRAAARMPSIENVAKFSCVAGSVRDLSLFRKAIGGWEIAVAVDEHPPENNDRIVR